LECGERKLKEEEEEVVVVVVEEEEEEGREGVGVASKHLNRIMVPCAMPWVIPNLFSTLLFDQSSSGSHLRSAWQSE